MKSAMRRRWPQVRALFEAAIAQPREARGAFVAAEAVDEEVRAAVLALLEGEGGPTLEGGDPGGNELAPGESIGNCRVLRTLGRGGMGVVYLAEQAQPQRQVAIKQLHGRHDEAALARFRREADLLARLSHPGIAQVHELGADARGRPFLVMEYVDGSGLTEHAAPLDRRARLELLAHIADAVEHAHLRGVVHRDLKPGNILVAADGQPKVLDFGIALLSGVGIESLTLTGALLGTPAYMSPEQALAGSNVDARADVYALGVIGYQLLADRLPLSMQGLTPLQSLRLVVEEQPLPLGRIDRRLRGDLETIFAKALAKDPRDRYPTAGALADDVRRHLGNEPIHARRVGPLRRLRLFARRNPALAAALALALAAMLLGSALSLQQASRARAQAARAEQAAATSEAVSRTLLKLLSAGHPDENGGAPATVVDLLKLGTDDALRELAGQPRVRRAVLAEIAALHAALGEDARVIELLEPELKQLPAADDEVGWRMALNLADALHNTADFEGAGRRFEQLQSGLSSRPWSDPLRHAVEIEHIDFLRERGEAAVALARARQLSSVSQTPELLSAALQAEADTLLAMNQYAPALAVLERLRELPEHAHTALQRARVDNLLARAYAELNRHDDAESLLRESLAWHERVLGADHPHSLQTRGELGNVLGMGANAPAGRELIADVLARRERMFGPQHPVVAVSLNQLALIDYTRGQHAQAALNFERAAEIWMRALGPRHPRTLTARSNLAGAQIEIGEAARALPVLEEVIAAQRETGFGGLNGLLITRGLALEQLGRQAEADRDFRESMAVTQAETPAIPSNWAWAQTLLGRSQRRLGELDRARELLERAIETMTNSTLGCGVRCALAHLELARTLRQQGEPRERWLPPAERALALRTERLGESHAFTAEARAFVESARQ